MFGGICIVTAAIFGIVGVVIGTVLSATLNFLLQRTQDRRRWEREDELKFEPERLALYRDFLNGMERSRPWDKSERERLSGILSEMELLSSRVVYERAYEAFEFSKRLQSAWSDEKGDYDPYDLAEAEDHLQELSYRFNRAVRKELGVVTDWKPTVITHKGNKLGVPEDLEQLRASEVRSWWQGMFYRWLQPFSE